jgi:hypothetical protein
LLRRTFDHENVTLWIVQVLLVLIYGWYRSSNET